LVAPAPAGFFLLVLAVALRKGLFPFHFWIPRVFEGGPLPMLGLMLNGHLGAYLMLRFVIPLFPEAAQQHLSLLGVFAITTAVFAALLALVAHGPRRILGLLCASQAAFVLAGLENRNVEGITGALLHWWVVAFATTTLLAVYRTLEARSADAALPSGFRGFGYHAPRLAVFFAVAAVALVGLPGTLGFAAEDLLFHGALDSHLLFGLGLPLATALNAMTALRILASLFFGKRGIHVAPIPDALPRERWALTIPVVLLIAGGVFPAVLIGMRAPLAREIAALLGSR
jgi:NADH-quinone oxidoreductase subunit M